MNKPLIRNLAKYPHPPETWFIVKGLTDIEPIDVYRSNSKCVWVVHNGRIVARALRFFPCWRSYSDAHCHLVAAAFAQLDRAENDLKRVERIIARLEAIRKSPSSPTVETQKENH